MSSSITNNNHNNNNEFSLDENMDFETAYLDDDSEVMKYVDLSKNDLTADFADLDDIEQHGESLDDFSHSSNGIGSFFSSSNFFGVEQKTDSAAASSSGTNTFNQNIQHSLPSNTNQELPNIKVENNEKSALERWKDRLAAAVPTFYTGARGHPDLSDSDLTISAGVPASTLNDLGSFRRDEGSISEAATSPSSDSGLNAISGETNISTAGTSPSVELNAAPTSSTSSVGNSKSTASSSGNFRAAQVRLSNMEFGRLDAVDAFDSPSVSEDTGVDNWDRFMEIHNATKYKHKMYICDFPKRSRVETQIKCRLIFVPGPNEHLVHLPPDTIARPRFQLRDGFEPNIDTLDLSVDVVSPSSPQKTLLMCPKCLNREKRRAFRKKNLDPNEESHWSETRNRRLAIFNCKEIVSLPLAKPCEISEGVHIQARELELPLRLVCYCRHHPAKNGFRVIFTARNYLGEIVGRAITDNVLITDDHKESKVLDRTSSVSSMSHIQGNGSTAPPSPLSMEESSDFSSSTSYKRRRESDWNGGSMLSSTSAGRVTRRYEVGSPSSSDGGGLSFNTKNLDPLSSTVRPTAPGNEGGAPVIMRVIPSQGSIRGGIEVTLLGSGFKTGLNALFGGVKSSSTHCWNESTIVTQLPPASQAGPVIVTFDGVPSSNPPMFRYIDDTDRQLIELALQVVGLKMNGKLEDARNIAMRIVGTNNNSPSGMSTSSTATSPGDSMNASTGVGFSDDHEEVILRCINLADLNQGMVPNWQLRNIEGQTMMHLAAILGYARVVSALIGRGARIDIPDLNGMCAIHFAAMFGHRRVVNKLLRNHADPYHETLNGSNAMDLASPQISDLLPSEDSHMMSQDRSRGGFRGPRGQRSASSSTVISNSSSSSSNSSVLSMPMLLAASKIPKNPLDSSDSFTDGGELDCESGFEDDNSIRDVSGIVASDMAFEGAAFNGGAPRAFTHYEGQNTPPQLGAGAAENISSYFHQLTTNARLRMQWDRRQWDRNWDEVVNYISRHTSRPERSDRQSLTETETEGTVVGSSSHADASRAASNSDSDATTVGGPRVSMARVWQYLTQQEMAARRALAHPPSYDEIFGTMAPAHNFEEEKQHEIEVEAKEEDAEEKFMRTWVTQRKQLKNDKMLFFFWIPVLLLTFLYVIGVTVIPQTYQPMEFLNTIKEWLSTAFLGDANCSSRAERGSVNLLGQRKVCTAAIG